jgi:hypothetical protein
VIRRALVALLGEIIALPDTMSKEFASMANNVPSNSDDAFETYWKTYLNEVVRRKLERVVSDHQTEILKFRRKWNIRPQGFKNRRSYNTWYKDQLRQYKTGRQIVYERVGEIPIETCRFAIKLPLQREPRKSEIHTLKISKNFLDYFRQRVLELATAINLDPTWILPFENYIFTNSVDMRYMPYTAIDISERISYSHAYKEMGRSICLTFGPNTRLKDIQTIWKSQVEPVFPRLTGYMEKSPRKERKNNRPTNRR